MQLGQLLKVFEAEKDSDDLLGSVERIIEQSRQLFHQQKEIFEQIYETLSPILFHEEKEPEPEDISNFSEISA